MTRIQEKERGKMSESSLMNGWVSFLGVFATIAMIPWRSRYHFCASVIPVPLSATTLNSNLPELCSC